MGEIILQYVLIVLLIVGLGYLVHILKDKDINLEEDYFGLTYAVLNTLQSDEATKENIKEILRLVSSIVQEIEVKYVNSDNIHKENQALSIAKKSIKDLGFESPIDDESIRYIIRLAAVMLPSKDEGNESIKDNLDKAEILENNKDNLSRVKMSQINKENLETKKVIEINKNNLEREEMPEIHKDNK